MTVFFKLWRALRRVAFSRCSCLRCKLAFSLSLADRPYTDSECDAWLEITDSLAPCPNGLRIEFPVVEWDVVPAVRCELRIARDEIRS